MCTQQLVGDVRSHVHPTHHKRTAQTTLTHEETERDREPQRDTWEEVVQTPVWDDLVTGVMCKRVRE